MLYWFFEQVVDGSGRLDYAVARVDVRKVRRFGGAATEGTSGAARSSAPPRYRNEIVVERRGEVRLPVDILVNFDDGSETREIVGRPRALVPRSTSPAAARLSYAVVDPEDKLPLDVDRLNNSRMRAPATRGIARLAGRWGLWLEGMLASRERALTAARPTSVPRTRSTCDARFASGPLDRRSVCGRWPSSSG